MKTLKELKEGAEQGNSSCQYRIGEIMIEEGKEWLRKAMKQDHASAKRLPIEQAPPIPPNEGSMPTVFSWHDYLISIVVACAIVYIGNNICKNHANKKPIECSKKEEAQKETKTEPSYSIIPMLTTMYMLRINSGAKR